MRILATIIFIVVAGAGMGLATAYQAIDSGFGTGTVATESWKGWLRAGAPEADPYTKAGSIRVRDLIMAPGQGLTLVAETDINGETLEGGCVYRVQGRAPTAQWWTLSVYDRDRGRPMANPAGRYGFTSGEVVRRTDGSFEIILSPTIRPGNHLPTEPGARLTLMLRLYEKPVALAGRIDPATLPSIVREACL